MERGEYARAVELLGARLKSDPADAAARRLLLRARLEVGRYSEAEAEARTFLEGRPEAGGVRHELAESLAATGRYGEALREFERAAADLSKAGGAPAARLESDVRRAEVLELTGQEDAARQIFDSLVRYYDEQEPGDAPSLTAAARAHERLGKYQDAAALYTEAVEADPTFIEAHLGAGRLFTEKYNYAEAAEFFADALKINPNNARAHLGVAANQRLEGGAEMTAALARALEINPNLVEARALAAALELEAGEDDDASAEIEKGLRVNPGSAEIHALRAAQLYLQDKDFGPAAAQALAVNPRDGALYETLAHYATITRRTSEAAEFSRRAVALQPRLWRAHLSLGMALLRLGRMEEGRAAVEKAFEGDPFNVWAKNTLDLLDALRDFRETRRGAFRIKAGAHESDVLGPLAADLLEEAAAKLTAKYRFTPKGDVVVELFPNHEDFAVRALGLPGLGALGVCFGPVIAQDSPSARPEGQFNWGSTLWHEYAHVITLQMTDYRIPRWFSEGLSVYEERRARPGWGDDWNPSVLRALAVGRWFKIAELDAGFMRPRRADDVPLAYFQASQVVEFITDRYGFDAVLRMLALYRDKARTPEVLRQALKLTEAEFDRAFAEYVGAKARPLQLALGAAGAEEVTRLPKDEVLKRLGAQETFALHLRAGALFRAEGDAASAARHFRRAAELFPYYTGPGNAYEAMADIFEKQADAEGAALALELLVKLDENNLGALRRLAGLRLEQGDRSRALEALRLSFYVAPFDHAAHARAGELYLENKDGTAALAEFAAALALRPPNVAEANYNVARAYHALGRAAEAKRSVLRALEAAPAFEKAQELLLTITGQ
ncbi:MAG: tetratricopeptide repeat protein [Acidobacteria bacterium]|nr:tetratricopeptide repeat protein [Acidobacteriota bacterium]MCA1621529.1 tetratricopeptide repeat protein [Acidobacteriota bacterium]